MTHGRVSVSFLLALFPTFACEGGGADRTPASESEATTNDALTLCSSANGGVARSKYKNAFFGNLHQHTMNSLDAYSFGTRASPADAYLFAKQQTSIQVGVGSSSPGPTVEID